jgi:hypothetical protein
MSNREQPGPKTRFIPLKRPDSLRCGQEHIPDESIRIIGTTKTQIGAKPSRQLGSVGPGDEDEFDNLDRHVRRLIEERRARTAEVERAGRPRVRRRELTIDL